MYAYTVFFLDLCHFEAQDSRETNIYSINYGIGRYKAYNEKGGECQKFWHTLLLDSCSVECISSSLMLCRRALSGSASTAGACLQRGRR